MTTKKASAADDSNVAENPQNKTTTRSKKTAESAGTGEQNNTETSASTENSTSESKSNDETVQAGADVTQLADSANNSVQQQTDETASPAVADTQPETSKQPETDNTNEVAQELNAGEAAKQAAEAAKVAQAEILANQPQTNEAASPAVANTQPETDSDETKAKNPLSITIINKGRDYYEMALKATLQSGVNRITFKSDRQRRIVLSNLAQLNALSGGGRFIIDKE
ncbi:hypothetical protein [Acinetobacter venetianus]|uniref:hypothetical protein n=1 Tax=Acinetobacter venetianus TaxID=52133 RepID=UPI003A95284B